MPQISSTNRSFLAILLSWVLFTQALLPVQSHSQMLQNPQGQWIAVCTLEGMETWTLDAQDSPLLNGAMAFSLLLSDHGGDVTQTLPEFLSPIGPLYTAQAPYLITQSSLNSCAIRAPPLVFI